MDNNYDHTHPFAVSFNSMKIRLRDLDNIISRRNFLDMDDKVNLFINFESIMNNLTKIKDIDKKVVLERNFVNLIIPEILNVAAHYRAFFRSNGLETRVFIYMTDVMSDKFLPQEEFIPDYRSYYIQKYRFNPKYCFLGDNLRDSIIPTTQTICEYLNGVYFISAHNMEGSLVPMIIADTNHGYKNIIITSDVYDLQYQFNNNFMTIYINRNKSMPIISDDIRDCMIKVFKDKNITDENKDIMMNKSIFLTALSAVGNKCRSIESIRGYGYITVLNLIRDAIDNGRLKADTKSFEMIKDILPYDFVEEFYNNYSCLDIEENYKSLCKNDIFNITTQMVDKYDNNALIQLNNTRFYDNQIRLEDLTM